MTATGDDGRRPTGWREFARSWWARAWLVALEENAVVDPNRLGRGRSYARAGRVTALEVSPGAVDALVQGSRSQPYAVVVGLDTFDGAAWEEVLDAVASRAGHAAALLDGELSPEVADDVAALGLDLLPSGRDLRLLCSCPDWAVPCKHAAAVCYQVALALDDDPFLLLELRGRSRDEVLDGVRRRRAEAGSGRAAEAEPSAAGLGVPAREVLAAGSRGVEEVRAGVRALLSHAPRRAARPMPLAVDPPASSGLEAEGLEHLVTDAAAVATGLLAGSDARRWAHLAVTGPDGTEHSLVEAARRASELGPGTALRRLAQATGVSSERLSSLARSWANGGAGAVAAAWEDWRPDAVDLEPGVEALTEVAGDGAAGDGRASDGGGHDGRGDRRRRVRRGPVVRVRGNRVGPTKEGWVQLRLGRDLRWYRLERVGGQWTVTEPPSTDPRDLLA